MKVWEPLQSLYEDFYASNEIDMQWLTKYFIRLTKGFLSLHNDLETNLKDFIILRKTFIIIYKIISKVSKRFHIWREDRYNGGE